MHDPDLDEYLTEYRLQTPAEPVSHYKDGELEARWLEVSGFSKLTKAFEEGREVQWKELNQALAGLAESHAEAVKQRVNALNRTVRGRNRTRHSRKPDIRDVFKDVDTASVGTRSRSATPDSLDFQHNEENGNGTALLPRKESLHRTPSAPLRGSAELFRGSHVRCDIPFCTEGIELVAFQRLGTIHIPRIRTSSDSNCSLVGHQIGDRFVKCSHHSQNSSSESVSLSPIGSSPGNSPPRDSILNSNHGSPNQRSSPEPVSFENLCRKTHSDDTVKTYSFVNESVCEIDDLTEGDYKKIKSLLWLELAALFDKHHVTLDKRKPLKRKKKEEGNVFGVSLNALVRRDQQIAGEDTSLVPLILQGILKELSERGLTEKGILRVAGHKQKTEALFNELETNFYVKPDKFESIVKRCGVHDLSATMKRWLRELPQPLLSNELIHLFYQANAIPSPDDQYQALSVLCLLLPHENRNTLRAIISFLVKVIRAESINKMSKHNVATIIAPSFFPPRFVHPIDKNDIGAQVQMAAKCCHLTNVLITHGDNMWKVPLRLLDEAKKINKPKHRQLKKTKSITTNNDSRVVNPKHVHRLVLQTGN